MRTPRLFLSAVVILTAAIINLNPATAQTPAPGSGATVTAPIPVAAPAPAVTPPATTTTTTTVTAAPAPVVPAAAASPCPPEDPCKGKTAEEKAANKAKLQKLAAAYATTTSFDEASCKLVCKFEKDAEGKDITDTDGNGITDLRPSKSLGGVCIDEAMWASLSRSQAASAAAAKAQADVAELRKALDESVAKGTATAADVVALRNELSTLATNLAGAIEAGKQVAIQAAMTAVEVFKSEFEGRLAAVEAKNTEQDGRIAAVETTVRTLDSRVTRVEERPAPFAGLEVGYQLTVGSAPSLAGSTPPVYFRVPAVHHAYVGGSAGVCDPVTGHCGVGSAGVLVGQDTNSIGFGFAAQAAIEFRAAPAVSLGPTFGFLGTAGGWSNGRAMQEAGEGTGGIRLRVRLPASRAAVVPTVTIEAGVAIGRIRYLQVNGADSIRGYLRLTFGFSPKSVVNWKAPPDVPASP